EKGGWLMDNGFTSLEEIKREYLIESNDIDEMVGALKGQLKEIHPDHEGGDFESGEQKERVLKLNAALDFVRKEGKKS
ncbi:hypothetical protein ADUPG1_001091, partial [Aduncisulcus paluster]